MSNYADYKPFNMVDGKGVRNSIYFSGCRFACVGCYNKVAQNFKYGHKFTQDVIDTILEDTHHSYVRGLSVLGGEPFQNIDSVHTLITQFKEEFKDTKDIWMWTGYRVEELLEMAKSDEKIDYLLNSIDVLVDGRFIQPLFVRDLPFRGSTNQRIIDIKQTLKTGVIKLTDDNFTKEVSK